MGQAPQHQQYLHCHKCLPTSPGGDGDGERVEQPASNTELYEVCRHLSGRQQVFDEPAIKIFRCIPCEKEGRGIREVIKPTMPPKDLQRKTAFCPIQDAVAHSARESTLATDCSGRCF